MSSSADRYENTRKKLNQVIQEYRLNRERLINIQTTTRGAFDQITNILKPSTVELLECINTDNFDNVAGDLGAFEIDQAKEEVINDAERLSKTIYEKQFESVRVEIGNPAIAIVGQVKAGKSTFVNMLLKKNVVCQAYQKCTARLTRLTYSSKNYLEIIDVDGKILKRKQLKKAKIPKKYLQLKEEERNNPEEINKQIKAGIKSEFLENGIDIIDSPGLSENATLNNLSKNMIKSILPVMIYIIDGRTSVKQTDISDLLELKNSVQNLQIIYFITKLDTDDLSETEKTDRVILAESKMEIAFKKLQYNNFIPSSFNHWSDCPFFHGASLYAYMDYYKGKRTPETTFHFEQFCKFEIALFDYLLLNFENKIYQATTTMIHFQMDVLTKIISRAQSLADFSKENLNQILMTKKMESELFEKITSVISTSKSDLMIRLVKKLEDESEAIINPIADIEYPAALCIPENGIVLDKKLIELCQSSIMYTLCQGLENVIKQFVEEELFQKYRSAIESQINSRMKNTIGKSEPNVKGKSSYCLCLERILVDNYKISSTTTLSNSESRGVILKLMNGILVSIKRFLLKHFKNDSGKKCIDVKTPQWKLQQAKECLNRCDHHLLAEEVCKGLMNDFEQKHNSFLIALEYEHKFVQKKIMMSEEIRMLVAEKAPDFAGLLMLTLAVKGHYMLQGVVEKEQIGQGAQGVVYRCKWNDMEIAKKTSTVHLDQLNDIAEEIYYSYSFEHPRLLRMIAVSIKDTQDSDYKEISIYSPLMKSDVFKYVKENVTTFKERIQIALQVAEALQYLHSQHIMHRDLKLANILLDFNNDVFLADYGFCKSMALTDHSFVGTPLHIAPEILRKEIYDHKVDIYSFGMFLWYLTEGTGRHPKFARLKSKVETINMRPERLSSIPDELWNLMENCWHDDATKRPEIDLVIERISEIISKYP